MHFATIFTQAKESQLQEPNLDQWKQLKRKKTNEKAASSNPPQG
jgi:hypothetical protein